MSAQRAAFPASIAYVLSVVLDKGLSIVTIPLVAAYVTPVDYGRLELAVSLIEFVGLLLTFGLADTLVRFAGPAGTATAERREAATLLGAALLLAAAGGLAIQAAASQLQNLLVIDVNAMSLRIALAGAAVGALIEMPLVWLRLRQRSDLFVVFVAVRSAIQLGATIVVLRMGLGVDGLLIANGLAVLAFAGILVVAQLRETGVLISADSFSRIGTYGIPLVGGSLAMFSLGTCSRWFMVGRIDNAGIATFGLAFKVALIAPLLLQPFALWWNPRRISVLQMPDGLEQSRRAWGAGFSILLASSTAIALCGPQLIHFALPASYAAAANLIPYVVLICFMNELNTLCNVGAYARKDGMGVLGVNAIAAITAITGYFTLVPTFGIAGIIAAMAGGHTCRLLMFLWIGRHIAPIAYPALAASVASLFAVAAIGLAPEATNFAARLIWTVLSGSILLLLLAAVQLLPIPRKGPWQRLKGWAHADHH